MFIVSRLTEKSGSVGAGCFFAWTLRSAGAPKTSLYRNYKHLAAPQPLHDCIHLSTTHCYPTIRLCVVVNR